MNNDLTSAPLTAKAAVVPGGRTPIHDGVPPVRTPAPRVEFVWGQQVSPLVLPGAEVDPPETADDQPATRVVATARIPEKQPTAG